MFILSTRLMPGTALEWENVSSFAGGEQSVPVIYRCLAAGKTLPEAICFTAGSYSF